MEVMTVCIVWYKRALNIHAATYATCHTSDEIPHTDYWETSLYSEVKDCHDESRERLAQWTAANRDARQACIQTWSVNRQPAVFTCVRILHSN